MRARCRTEFCLLLTVSFLMSAGCSFLLDDDGLSRVNDSTGSEGGAAGHSPGSGEGGADGSSTPSDTGGAGRGGDGGAAGEDGATPGDGGTPGGGSAGTPGCPAGAVGCACLPDASCDSGLSCVDSSCRVQTGCSPATLIDDLEDNDRFLCPNASRNGAWFAFAASATGSLVPASGALAPTSIATDPRPTGASARAMRLAGTGFGDVAGSDYAALAFSFRVENGTTRAYDLRAHDEIGFWAKSDVPVKMRFNLTTIPTRGVPQGGACTATCNDHFGVFFDVTPTWTRFTVPFDAMTQQGWGSVATKDLAQAYSADFMYVGRYEGSRLEHDNPSDFVFLVDDVELH